MESSLKDKEPSRVNTMEGINFMGHKMLIEVDSFEKKFNDSMRHVHNVLGSVDINSRLEVEKNLDSVAEEINELKRRVENSIVLNEYNIKTSMRN